MGTLDYIPQAHDAFFAWQNNFYSYTNENLSSFKIEPEKFDKVTAAKGRYELAYWQASNPDAANRADRVERNESEAEYKRAIRAFVNAHIRFNEDVSDYDRKYMGLTVADTTPTRARVPATHPVIEIDFSEAREHTLYLRDEAKTGRAKPAGVRNAEVWRKVGGGSPVGDGEMTLAGTTSNGKLRLGYDLALVGSRVYYQARWVNTRSQAGGFGEVVWAIIG